LLVKNSALVDVFGNTISDAGVGIDSVNNAFTTTGNKYIQINNGAHTFGPTENFTIYAWVKCNSSKLLPILLGTGVGGQGLMVGDSYYTDGVQFDYTSYGNKAVINYCTTMRNGLYNNVVLCKNQNSLVLYVNGKNVYNVSIVSLTITFSNSIVGWDGSMSDRYSDYSIKEIGMYDKCLFNKDFTPSLYQLINMRVYKDLFGKLFGYK